VPSPSPFWNDYQNIALRWPIGHSLAGRATITVFNDHLAILTVWSNDFDRSMSCASCASGHRCRARSSNGLPRLKLIASTAGRNARSTATAAAERRHRRGAYQLRFEPDGRADLGSYPGERPTHRCRKRRRPFRRLAARHRRWSARQDLGILGLGKIGSEIARIGLAFGMEVIAWSQNLTSERAEAHGTRLASKDELFRRADIVTIHLVLSDRTEPGRRAELGGDEAIGRLVNTSRGPIVEEAALVAALRERRIAGAAIDVFDVEPLPPDHPFRSLENALATPHIGYVSRELYKKFYGDTVQQHRRVADQRPKPRREKSERPALRRQLDCPAASLAYISSRAGQPPSTSLRILSPPAWPCVRSYGCSSATRVVSGPSAMKLTSTSEAAPASGLPLRIEFPAEHQAASRLPHEDVSDGDLVAILASAVPPAARERLDQRFLDRGGCAVALRRSGSAGSFFGHQRSKPRVKTSKGARRIHLHDDALAHRRDRDRQAQGFFSFSIRMLCSTSSWKDARV